MYLPDSSTAFCHASARLTQNGARNRTYQIFYIRRHCINASSETVSKVEWIANFLCNIFCFFVIHFILITLSSFLKANATISGFSAMDSEKHPKR